MLIEKIIKFELRGPELPGRTCTPKTGYFQDKNLKAISSIKFCLLLKFLQEAM